MTLVPIPTQTTQKIFKFDERINESDNESDLFLRRTNIFHTEEKAGLNKNKHTDGIIVY